MLRLRVLFDDEYLVVVDKPTNFHSHAPEDKSIRLNKRWDATSILQSQLEQRLYPTHRLDRQTSGLLLFAKSSEVSKKLHLQFQERRIEKTYFCCIRGVPKSAVGRIDHELKRPSGTYSKAITEYETLFSFAVELPPPGEGEFSKRMFSLLSVHPRTGSFHQIRRHMASISCPIVNDRQHGDRKLNTQYKAFFSEQRMFLRAMQLEFQHPITAQRLKIRNRWNRDWHFLFEKIGYCPILE